MIRKNPCHDPSAGCFQFEKPLTKAIEEYKEVEVREGLKIALQEAYERGWWDGYAKCDDEHLEARKALDPSSEESR